MRRLLIAAATAFAIVLNPAPAAAQAAQQGVGEQVDALVRAVGDWAQANNARIQALMAELDRIVVLETILTEVGEGKAAAGPSHARVDAWSAGYESGLMAARASFLAAAPPPDLSLLGPEGANLQIMLSNSQQANVQAVDRLIVMGADLALMAHAALNGEVDAMEAAGATSIRGGIELLQLENATIHSATTALSPSHPNASLLLGRRAINSAIVLYLEAVLRDEAAADDKARLSALATETRRHADTARANNTRFIAMMSTAQDVPQTLRDRVRAAFATVPASADVLTQMANDIDAIALTFSGESIDFDAADVLLDAIIAKNDILIQHDGARAAALAAP